MTLLQKIAGAIPLAKTPTSASSTTAALVVLILGCLNGWHWWASQSTAVQTAAATVLAFALAQLAAWWNVVRQPGQTVSLELTKSPLPTLQAAPEDAVTQ